MALAIPSDVAVEHALRSPNAQAPDRGHAARIAAMSLGSRVAYPVRTALTARRHCWGGPSKSGARETAQSDTRAGQVEMQGVPVKRGSTKAGRGRGGTRAQPAARHRSMVRYGAQVSATCWRVIRIVTAYVAASMISPAFP